MAPSKRIGRDAFTLIEVMIALFVLVLIGTATSKAVVEAAKLKEVLKDETEFASEFRTSISFMERDLSQVFNPKWFLPENFKPIDPFNPPAPTPPPAPGTFVVPRLSIDEITRRTQGTAFQTYEYWGPILDSTGIRASRFKGKATEMSFVSASHVRIYQQKKESIFAKVKYELIREPEPERGSPYPPGLYQLVKTENTRAFEVQDPKDAPYITQYVILNHIKSLKFLYYQRDEKEPAREWDSEGTDGKKSFFPISVDMEVSIIGPKGRTIDAQVSFNLETPNEILPSTY